MPLFKNLFKKKEGGTFAGNLLRGIFGGKKKSSGDGTGAATGGAGGAVGDALGGILGGAGAGTSEGFNLGNWFGEKWKKVKDDINAVVGVARDGVKVKPTFPFTTILIAVGFLFLIKKLFFNKNSNSRGYQNSKNQRHRGRY